jgi:hypothetical protein
MPITAPARTLLDLAATLPERPLDEAVVRCLVREADLTVALATAPRRAGAARLGGLLDEDLGTTVTRSKAEERFLALVRAEELPSPA